MGEDGVLFAVEGSDEGDQAGRMLRFQRAGKWWDGDEGDGWRFVEVVNLTLTGYDG